MRGVINGEGRAARRHWARAVVCACAGLLGACASAPPATYDLGVIQGGFKARPRGGQIAVYQPKAVSPVDSDRIVVRVSDDQIAYLSGAQWVAQLPALVQARLISSFLNAHVIGAVEPGGLADYNLRTDIRRFEFDAARAAAFVEMSAQLAEFIRARARWKGLFGERSGAGRRRRDGDAGAGFCARGGHAPDRAVDRAADLNGFSKPHDVELNQTRQIELASRNQWTLLMPAFDPRRQPDY